MISDIKLFPTGVQCFEDEVHKHQCHRIFDEFFIEDSLEFFWGADSSGEAIYELTEDQSEMIESSDVSKRMISHTTDRSCN